MRACGFRGLDLQHLFDGHAAQALLEGMRHIEGDPQGLSAAVLAVVALVLGGLAEALGGVQGGPAVIGEAHLFSEEAPSLLVDQVVYQRTVEAYVLLEALILKGDPA